MSFDNVMQIVAQALALIGGGFAIWKWRGDKAQERASRLDALRSQFYAFNPEVILQKMRATTMESEPSSMEDTASDIKEETTRKSFFSFLAHICYLMETKVISEKEFVFFKWQIVRLLETQSVYDAIAVRFYDRFALSS